MKCQICETNEVTHEVEVDEMVVLYCDECDEDKSGCVNCGVKVPHRNCEDLHPADCTCGLCDPKRYAMFVNRVDGTNFVYQGDDLVGMIQWSTMFLQQGYWSDALIRQNNNSH